MDAVELLVNQHRRLEARMERLHETLTGDRAPVGAAGTPSDSAGGSAEVATQLADIGDHLSMHLASEEEIFYPAVRAARTEDILLESLEEHLSLKRLLSDLLKLSPDEQTFGAKFKVLKEQTEHHHREEEEHLFPSVCKTMEAPARAALGERILGLQQRMMKAGAPREVAAEQTEAAMPLGG